MNILLVLFSTLLLYFGGDVLVKNAARLALAIGMSPLVIGLTVVAFGTSSPELLTTLIAAFQGSADVAMGNIVGSNITNLGLILGLSALIYPLRARSRLIRLEVPFMIGVAVLLLPFSHTLTIGRVAGAFLLGLLLLYLLIVVRNSEDPSVDDEFSREYGESVTPVWKCLLGLILGIGLLLLGAQLMIKAAVTLARSIGVSERVIGLSLVALSTSLPELASSLVAAFKREADILLGNLIGSNIFNILGILGVTAIVKPIPVSPEIFRVDLWVMIGISVLVLPFLSSRLRLERWEGGVLLGLYVAYIFVIYR